MADTIIQRLPTGDYLTSFWAQNTGSSAHYTYVDDAIGANDGDTTYIFRYSSTYGDNVLFSYTGFGVPSNARNIALKIYVIARRDSVSATPVVAGAIKIDSVVYSGTGQSITDSYAEYITTWTNDPSTSAAWTASGINGVDYIGAYATRAGIFGGYSQPRVTQIYAEVSYNLKAPYACAGPGIVVGAESVSAG